MQGRHMGMIRSLICHPKIRQLYRIGSMLCMYICIIALAAIGVLTYVRSISVATDNKGIFESLTKLGADHAYQRMVLKKQLAKIFFYPGIVGCGAGFLFSFLEVVEVSLSATGLGATTAGFDSITGSGTIVFCVTTSATVSTFATNAVSFCKILSVKATGAAGFSVFSSATLSVGGGIDLSNKSG